MVPILLKNKKQVSDDRTLLEESLCVRAMIYLEEAGHFVVSADNYSMGLSLNFASLIVIVRHVPSAQPGFPLPILQ
jgi:hypothetical protein